MRVMAATSSAVPSSGMANPFPNQRDARWWSATEELDYRSPTERDFVVAFVASAGLVGEEKRLLMSRWGSH